jgi:hypothetical protein
MYEGYINFSAKMGSITIDSFEMDVGISNVLKVVINAKDGIFLVKCYVYVESAEDIDSVAAICKEMCDDVANRISFYFSDRIDELECGGRLVDEDGDVLLYRSSVTRVATAELAWRVGVAAGSPEFMEYIYDSNSNRNFFYKMYRFVMGVENPVQRAMFLYNIILQINGDRQNSVENMIISIDPSVKIYESYNSRGKIVEETLFTKLRNEVCHARNNSGHKQVCKELQDNISYFQWLVRKAIALVG